MRARAPCTPPNRRPSHGSHTAAAAAAVPIHTHRVVTVDHDYNKDGSSISDVHDAPKLKLATTSQGDGRSSKNTQTAPGRKRRRSGSTAEQDATLSKESAKPVCKPPRKKKPKPTGCRCGMATPNPGTLTCRGQRCPCYSSFQGCVNCRCRGCLNPRGEVTLGPPVLEKGHDSGSNDTESDVDID